MIISFFFSRIFFLTGLPLTLATELAIGSFTVVDCKNEGIFKKCMELNLFLIQLNYLKFIRTQPCFKFIQ